LESVLKASTHTHKQMHSWCDRLQISKTFADLFLFLDA